MADLPYARGTLSQAGAGVGVGQDWILILACSQSGTAASIRRTSKVQDTRDTFGLGPGLEFAGHYVQQTKLPYLFAKLATATAGAIGPVDIEGVTGTSVVTFTGTPHDEEHIIVECVTGFTVGTVGGAIRISRDGGRTWGGAIRVGTATTYAIPDTGVTANFAAGTMIAGDRAVAYTSMPMWDSAGLAACLDAAKAYPTRPRIILVIGECDAAAEAQACIDEITAYETEADRHSVIICQLRDKYAPAKMQGDPSDLDFVAAADTITRNTGSWVTDGFKVGMDITIAGTASNNAYTGTAVTVTTTVLTVSNGLADEANLSGVGVTISGTESNATWRAAIEAILGSTPSTLKTSEKVVACGGRLRRTSAINRLDQRRRPFSWPLAIRVMQHDIHVSAAKVASGPLTGWDAYDTNGILAEHDQRIDGGLLAARIACHTSHLEKPGAYVALPLTLAEDNTQLSRLPITLVGQLACTVAQAAYVDQLSSEIATNSDGTIAESAARSIDAYVNAKLSDALLNEGKEGARAQSATARISRVVDMRNPGTVVPWEVDLRTFKYLEKLSGTVRVGG